MRWQFADPNDRRELQERQQILAKSMPVQAFRQEGVDLGSLLSQDRWTYRPGWRPTPVHSSSIMWSLSAVRTKDIDSSHARIGSPLATLVAAISSEHRRSRLGVLPHRLPEMNRSSATVKDARLRPGDFKVRIAAANFSVSTSVLSAGYSCRMIRTLNAAFVAAKAY